MSTMAASRRFTMDIPYNSESNAARDGWSCGDGGPGVEWRPSLPSELSSWDFPEFPSPPTPGSAWLLTAGGDPFLSSGPLSDRVAGRAAWTAAPDGPREEATPLADHLYCRKAQEAAATAQFMDPFIGCDMSEYPLMFSGECTSPSTSSYAASAATTAPLGGPPTIDQTHMDWLETFAPIPNAFDGVPSDLDATAGDVDWAVWMRYLGDESKEDCVPSSSCLPYSPESIHDPLDEKNDHGYTLDYGREQGSMDFGVVAKEENEDFFSGLSRTIPKQEPEEYSPQCDDVKPSVGLSATITTTPLSPLNHRRSYFSPSPSLTDKPKRGRPKKLRLPEDHSKMSPAERRKAMNRDAALRYRERKRADMEELKKLEEDLSVKNDVLRMREEQLNREIAVMKEKFRDAGFPI